MEEKNEKFFKEYLGIYEDENKLSLEDIEESGIVTKEDLEGEK